MEKKLVLKNDQGEVFASVSGTIENIEYLASFLYGCFIDDGHDPDFDIQEDAIEIIEFYPHISKMDKLSFETKDLQEREFPEWNKEE